MYSQVCLNCLMKEIVYLLFYKASQNVWNKLILILSHVKCPKRISTHYFRTCQVT